MTLSWLMPCWEILKRLSTKAQIMINAKTINKDKIILPAFMLDITCLPTSGVLLTVLPSKDTAAFKPSSVMISLALSLSTMLSWPAPSAITAFLAEGVSVTRLSIVLSIVLSCASASNDSE